MTQTLLFYYQLPQLVISLCVVEHVMFLEIKLMMDESAIGGAIIILT